MSEGVIQEGDGVLAGQDEAQQGDVEVDPTKEVVAPPLEEIGKISLEVLGLLPVTAEKVLHLWAGRGALALKVRLRNPSVDFTCVDLEDEPTESSARFASSVYRGDPESLLAEKAAEWKGMYDAVILDRGWERSRRPKELIQAASEVVLEGGSVLVRQSNGSNWWVVADLLSGAWGEGQVPARGPYFSVECVRSWIERSGLQVMGVLGKKGRPEVPEFARAVGVAATSPDLSLDERVWRGVKGGDVQRMHVAFFSGGARGCEDRIRAWIGALATLPGVSVSVFEGRMQLPKVGENVRKILVLHRFFPASEAECARVRQEVEKQGWSMVFLLDEQPDDLPEDLREKAGPVPLGILRSCDGVMCPVESLKALVESGTGDVRVFEDGLLELPVMASRDASKPIIHLSGLEPSEPPHPWVGEIERVLLRNPDATLLVEGERALFDSINVGNKRFAADETGTSAMSFLRCSIAILGGGARGGAQKFGRPFLRAASHGMACVAAGSAYEGLVKHGVTGALVGSASSFGEALEILIREPIRCVAMARAARAWVSEHRMLSRTILDQAAWLRDLPSRNVS